MSVRKAAQWYLCQIDNYPQHEGEKLKPTDNLSVKYPDIFMDGFSSLLLGDDFLDTNSTGEGSWFIWLPIIPRVGDTLQMAGWQVHVSRVLLPSDFSSKNGIHKDIHVSAQISIRSDTVTRNMRFWSSIEKSENHSPDRDWDWETFANRGNDLQFFAWELHHDYYIKKQYEHNDSVSYFMWHTRVRPIEGDIINVQGDKWKIRKVELSSANDFCDGLLYLGDSLTI